MIEPIAGIQAGIGQGIVQPLAPIGAAGGIGPAGATPGIAGSFLGVVQGAVVDVDGRIERAEGLLRSVAAGEDVPTHELMIAFEEARLSLQTAVEVRNRLVEAYQDMLRMQL